MANSGFCQNPFYQKLLCQDCPKECSQYCVVPSPDSSCHDTASNCKSMKDFCNNPIYKPLMNKECPSTCDTCSGKTSTHITKKFLSTTNSPKNIKIDKSTKHYTTTKKI